MGALISCPKCYSPIEVNFFATAFVCPVCGTKCTFSGIKAEDTLQVREKNRWE
jgi:hypothetical protein